MCISDWRIGLLLRSVITPIAITSAATIVVPANRQRVGFFLNFNAAASGGGLSADLLCETMPIGRYTAFQVPLLYTLETHGDLCTRQLTISSNVAGISNGGYIEWFLPENVTSAYIEEFRRNLGL